MLSPLIILLIQCFYVYYRTSYVFPHFLFYNSLWQKSNRPHILYVFCTKNWHRRDAYWRTELQNSIISFTNFSFIYLKKRENIWLMSNFEAKKEAFNQSVVILAFKKRGGGESCDASDKIFSFSLPTKKCITYKIILLWFISAIFFMLPPPPLHSNYIKISGREMRQRFFLHFCGWEFRKKGYIHTYVCRPPPKTKIETPWHQRINKSEKCSVKSSQEFTLAFQFSARGSNNNVLWLILR